MNWFEAITGFAEQGYAQAQRRLSVVDGKLASDASPKRYAVGTLQTPSLRELRERTATVGERRRTRVGLVQGDVRKMHSAPQNEGALFQVASQFNLLEMVSYTVSPEDGVTRYQGDPTQGPACAIAAGAATIYRNYLHTFPAGSRGQTAQRQIDCIADLGQALGNANDRLWTMRNGYAMFSEEGLRAVDERLAGLPETELDDLRSLLRIGLHGGVDVTDREPGHAVSQAFCSALPVSYNRLPVPRECWQRVARLVLEAAYEATLRAGLLQAQAGGSNVVFLTRLGGGAFGNETEWIHAAMRRAFAIAAHFGLDVRVVSYGRPDRELVDLVEGA
jgi:hypothetical protein